MVFRSSPSPCRGTSQTVHILIPDRHIDLSSSFPASLVTWPAMVNVPTAAFAPGAQDFNAAPESSFQERSFADNSLSTDGTVGGDGNYVPRPKRIACVVCRRRKLRCDGKRPSCGTCSRLGHECAYDEVRKKSGPKRGYVKQLEARLGTDDLFGCLSLCCNTPQGGFFRC